MYNHLPQSAVLLFTSTHIYTHACHSPLIPFPPLMLNLYPLFSSAFVTPSLTSYHALLALIIVLHFLHLTQLHFQNSSCLLLFPPISVFSFALLHSPSILSHSTLHNVLYICMLPPHPLVCISTPSAAFYAIPYSLHHLHPSLHYPLAPYHSLLHLSNPHPLPLLSPTLHRLHHHHHLHF